MNKKGYIDPGTGSAIFGSVWPMILAIFTAIGAFLAKWLWKPIKRFFKRKKDGRTLQKTN